MKKLVTIFALFTMVMLTSFVEPSDIGGKQQAGTGSYTVSDIGGKQQAGTGSYTVSDIGGKQQAGTGI